MGRPDSCQWFGEEDEENCDRNADVDLYEYGEGDNELWVCDGHFTQHMNGKTPARELDGKWVMSGHVADKLDELRNKHGYVINDEEGLKQFIEDLREPADEIFKDKEKLKVD